MDAVKKPSKFRKYGPYVGVPAGIVAIIVIDLVNNINHRNAVEKSFPSIVNLIRKYYGFADENPEELRRLRILETLTQSQMNVELNHGGMKTVLANIEGTRKCSELTNHASIREIYGTNLLSFPDTDSEDSLAAQGEVGVRKLIDVSKMVHISRNLFEDSEWNITPIQEQSQRFVLTQQSLLLQKYNNVLNAIFQGFRSYYRLGATNTFYSLASFQENVVVEYKSQKELAQERIQQLQYQLERLQQDRLIGIKDIDTVQQEIQQTKNEIISLQRKYVNSFYYW